MKLLTMVETIENQSIEEKKMEQEIIPNLDVEEDQTTNLEDKEDDVEQKLRQVDEEFSVLETLDRDTSDEKIEAQTKIAMNKLIEIMNQAKDEGLSIEQVRDALPNAYRVHGYSSFVAHLRKYRKQQGHFTSIDILVDRIETGVPNIEPHLQKLGKIIGETALDCPLAQQHREKLKIQANIVEDVCKRVESPHIMMIASGSARDLEQIQPILIQSNAKITLVDIYPEALDAALDNLKEFLGEVENPDEQLLTYPVDVTALFRLNSESSKRFRRVVFAGEVDVLVSGGLFDYFRDVSVKKLLETINSKAGNIKEDGIVLFTNIASDVDNPYLVWADVMGYWSLRARTEEKMKELQNFLEFSENSLELDPTGFAWIAKSVNSKKK